MKQVKFVPDQCKGDNPEYSGFVMLKVPNFDQKWEMLEAIGLELDGEGAVKMEKAKGLSFIRKAVAAAKPYFAEVEIKGKSVEYKSYDDLSEDSDAHPMLIGASLAVVSGVKPGNV